MPPPLPIPCPPSISVPCPPPLSILWPPPLSIPCPPPLPVSPSPQSTPHWVWGTPCPKLGGGALGPRPGARCYCGHHSISRVDESIIRVALWKPSRWWELGARRAHGARGPHELRWEDPRASAPRGPAAAGEATPLLELPEATRRPPGGPGAAQEPRTPLPSGHSVSRLSDQLRGFK